MQPEVPSESPAIFHPADLEDRVRMRRILDFAWDAYISVDTGGTVSEWNLRAYTMFGWQRTEVLGQKLMQFIVPPRYREAYTTWFQGIVTRSDVSMKLQYDALHRDGHEFPVEAVVFTHTETGKITVNAFVRSLEEQKRIEKLKDTFVSTISHEIRTPLAIVKQALTNLQISADQHLPSKAQDMLSVAMKNTHRLGRIIVDLLDLSKLESGTAMACFERIKMYNIIQEVLEGYRFEATERGIALVEDVDTPLYTLEMEADTDMIMQLFNNLLSNAVRFARKQIVFQGKAQSNSVHLMIEDDGEGIPPSRIESIFGKFVQLDRTEGGGYRGTGMGLLIAKRIVQLHHGRIWAESEVCKGARFHVVLPISQYTRSSE